MRLMELYASATNAQSLGNLSAPPNKACNGLAPSVAILASRSLILAAINRVLSAAQAANANR